MNRKNGALRFLFVCFFPFLHHVPYRTTCIYIFYNNAPKQHSLNIHYTLVYYAQEGPRKMTCHAGKEGGRGFFRVYIYITLPEVSVGKQGGEEPDLGVERSRGRARNSSSSSRSNGLCAQRMCVFCSCSLGRSRF